LRCDDLEVTCDPRWLSLYSTDFKRRFVSLLGQAFRELSVPLSLSVVHSIQMPEKPLTKPDIDHFLLSYDLKRLESYSRNLVDFHLILDILPEITRRYFLNGKETKREREREREREALIIEIICRNSDSTICRSMCDSVVDGSSA
jgi:tRNA(Met) C34 N-acetyltransferase TmcA